MVEEENDFVVSKSQERTMSSLPESSALFFRRRYSDQFRVRTKQ